MKILFYTLLVSFINPMTFASSPCSVKEVKAAKNNFKIQFEKKNYEKAREVYAKLEDQCRFLPVEKDKNGTNDLYYWMESDVALALYKEGNATDCLKRLAPLMHPMFGYAGYIDGDSPAAKALNHNNELCEELAHKDEKSFKDEVCTFSDLPKNLSSVKINSSSCLFLVVAPMGKEYTLSPDADDPTPEKGCPKVMRATLSSNKLNLETIKVSDGPLSDPSSCCGLEKLSFKEDKKQLLINLTSFNEQPPCGGRGTARFRPSGIYGLKDGQLNLVKDTTVSSH
jgi:hypothetical protein